MTTRFGVREITRNFNILENYDYVEIEDKKTHTLKGLFVSAELLEDVKTFLDKKIKAKKRQELDEMMQFVGMVNGDFGEQKAQDIKSEKIV
ncbi:hypothetical protein [Sulfurimonas sp.]|uniref:hypothetical protein n=1 Tax=Sulfurimonas sp. TaxID=2022749 RepID=UPI003D0B63D2